MVVLSVLRSDEAKGDESRCRTAFTGCYSISGASNMAPSRYTNERPGPLRDSSRQCKRRSGRPGSPISRLPSSCSISAISLAILKGL